MDITLAQLLIAALGFFGGAVFTAAGFTAALVLWIWRKTDELKKEWRADLTAVQKEARDDCDAIRADVSMRYHRLDGAHSTFSTLISSEIRTNREDIVRIKTHLGLNGAPRARQR